MLLLRARKRQNAGCEVFATNQALGDLHWEYETSPPAGCSGTSSTSRGISININTAPVVGPATWAVGPLAECSRGESCLFGLYFH
jgi:hypothetical protein